jgi:hypothetical protein
MKTLKQQFIELIRTISAKTNIPIWEVYPSLEDTLKTVKEWLEQKRQEKHKEWRAKTSSPSLQATKLCNQIDVLDELLEELKQ